MNQNKSKVHGSLQTACTKNKTIWQTYDAVKNSQVGFEKWLIETHLDMWIYYTGLIKMLKSWGGNIKKAKEVELEFESFRQVASYHSDKEHYELANHLDEIVNGDYVNVGWVSKKYGRL